MSSRSAVIKLALRSSRFLRSDLTFENLAAKRATYAKLSRRFPVSKSVSIIKLIKATGFKAEWLIQDNLRYTS